LFPIVDPPIKLKQPSEAEMQDLHRFACFVGLMALKDVFADLVGQG